MQTFIKLKIAFIQVTLTFKGVKEIFSCYICFEIHLPHV